MLNQITPLRTPVCSESYSCVEWLHTTTHHPDRNAQFETINTQVQAFQAAGQLAISVDTKKKELVGDFKNAGRELRPKGQPEPVRVHDFALPELGKVAPYDVYDIAANTGWVNLGITSDTATFAVESIRRWWHELAACPWWVPSDFAPASLAGLWNGHRRPVTRLPPP